MTVKDLNYTYVWSINKRMIVARSIKQAIDIYCVNFDTIEDDIHTIDRIDCYGDYTAIIVDPHKAEEAQP